MDELLYILQRYWWLVGLVLLRLVFSSFEKKKKSQANGKTQKSKLQEYLEKMRAELEPSSGQSSYSKAREEPSSYKEEDFYGDDEKMPPRYVPHSSGGEARASHNVKTLVEEIGEKTFAEANQPMESGMKPQSPAGTEKTSFPQNLDYLPPLQRAIVLSEILGPPKGLD